MDQALQSTEACGRLRDPCVTAARRCRDGAETVEKKEPIDNEFTPDPGDDMEDDAIRASRMNRVMQGVARQVSLDPGDDVGL
jgi:type IV secretion system protein VirD4